MAIAALVAWVVTAGGGLVLFGTWLTRVATAWLVHRLAGSALLLGLVGFAGQIPTFLIAPIAGVLVDRWNRHRVLVVTQALAMVQSALLAWFSLRGTITVLDKVVEVFEKGPIDLESPPRPY